MILSVFLFYQSIFVSRFFFFFCANDCSSLYVMNKISFWEEESRERYFKDIISGMTRLKEFGEGRGDYM